MIIEGIILFVAIVATLTTAYVIVLGIRHDLKPNEKLCWRVTDHANYPEGWAVFIEHPTEGRQIIGRPFPVDDNFEYIIEERRCEARSKATALNQKEEE